jgi:hypothetical protein
MKKRILLLTTLAAMLAAAIARIIHEAEFLDE